MYIKTKSPGFSVMRFLSSVLPGMWFSMVIFFAGGCREPGVRPPRCGDGIVQGWEECDNGINEYGTGCTPDCRLESPEICGSYDDESGNGLADCADPACFGHPVCEQDPPIENCHNGIDDSGNGLTDCEDPVCWGTSFCIPEEDCENGIDDTGNGLTDCEDPFCKDLPICGACDPEVDLGVVGVGTEVVREIDQEPSGDLSPMSCPFGSMPDVQLRFTIEEPMHVHAMLSIPEGFAAGLGLLKEAMPDVVCKKLELACNETGNSGEVELMRDALPPGTYRLTAKPGSEGFGGPGVLEMTLEDGTLEHRCDDGVDNNRNGLTDCEDPDCADWPGCMIEDCENGIDDNGNGLTDCEDPDCWNHPACLPPEICDSGVDEDMDGFTDCEDIDCMGTIWCTGSDCVINRSLGVLTRGDEVFWNFDTSYATSNNHIPCGGDWTPDLVGAFRLEHESTVRISMHQTGYHVMALGTEAGEGTWCDDAIFDCTDPGGLGLPIHRALKLPAARYFVLVEAKTEEATGMGEIHVRVYDPNKEICDDGVDNTGNGLTDCEDPACTDSPLCMPETNCHNGLDDDGDGHIDCADLDCIGTPACSNPACTVDRDMGIIGPLSPGYVTDSTETSSDRFATICAIGGGGKDRVYSFRLEQETGVTIRMHQASGSDHVVSLALPGGPGANCDAAQHLCTEGGGSGLPIISNISYLPPGEYYLIVEAYGPWGTGDFNLQVSLW